MRKFFNSLTFKIGIIIILVEIIVLAVTGFYYINRFSAQVDARVRSRIELPGALVARGLLNFGSVADETVMTELVGEGLVDGMVVGADKIVLHSLNPAYVRQAVADVPGLDPAWFEADLGQGFLAETNDSLISITPIRAFAEETSSFFVYIKVGVGQAEREKRAIAGLFVLGSIFSIIITSIAIIYLFNSTILSRVREVLGVLKQVEGGNLAIRMEESILPDEIGVLQQGVNSMAAHLEETVGRLERRVADLNQAQDVLQRWGHIFKHAGWGIVISEVDSHLMALMNPAFAKMHGYAIEELTGRPAAEVFAPDMATQLPLLIGAQPAAGAYTFESKQKRKDGTTFPALVNVTTVKGQDGRLLYRIINIQDITEQKRAESALKAYAAELERSNRELEDFANVAAHDLQEPLRKVQAFGDRIVNKYDAVLDERGRDYLARMQSAAARMQTLINDLLSFSRVTSKAQPFGRVDLTAIARGVLSDLETRIEEVGAQVQLNPLPAIDADQLQMRQLFQNLISNALKFHHPTRRAVVKIEGQRLKGNRRQGDLCQISVADNGIGFDEKYLDRIFTVFQRLHGRNEYEGTGIGLAVCRKIVERHGGHITAKSRPDQGATFIVTLPVRQTNDKTE